MDVRAGEEGPRRVGRVAGLRSERDIARIETGEGDVGDPFLAAKDGDDLGFRVDVDAEPLLVEGRNCAAKRVQSAVCRVPVRRRVRGCVPERADHRLGRREVGVADPEADHVDALAPLLLDLPLQLGEEVGRNEVESLCEPHPASHSGLSSPRADLLCRPREPRVQVGVELDEQVAPGEVDGDGAVAPSVHHRGAGDSAGARARGEGLPRPALPDARGRVRARVDTDELHVRPVGKARVVLDKRAEPQKLFPCGIAGDDGMRISHGNGRELELRPVHVERLGRRDLDRAHVHLDLEAAAHAGVDLALADGDRDLVGAGTAGEPASGDPRPVARELRGRAVRVPDDDLRA